MKKLLLSLFFVLISTVQSSFAQCDLDYLYINTGSNMTVFFTPAAASAIAADLGEGTIGAFFLTENDAYFCAGSSIITGAQVQLAVMGDDATTDSQDGFNSNQEMLWFYLSNDGSVYSLDITPSEVFSNNGMTFITSYISTSVDCNVDVVEGCTDPSADNYNSDANVNDDSCTYTIYGCTDSEALNYNASATDDNGSCEYEQTGGDCELPNQFVGNTGSNMTVMLTPAFVSSLNATESNAYIVALTSEGMVVGSSNLFEISQTSLAIWGDDSQTTEIDGALAGEAISFQLVNGTDLYDVTIPEVINFSDNGIVAQTAAGVLTAVDCGSAEVPGCMDVLAFNYNPSASIEDGSCVVIGLSLQGVIDFTIPNSSGNSGRGLHFKALEDISDLSVYGFGIANGSLGSDGQEYSFESIAVFAGEDILILKNPQAMEDYLGDCYSVFEHILEFPDTPNVNNFTGDDAVEVFMSGELIETFGDVNIDGSGQDWEYLDSWAYKIDGEWTYGGVNCTDDSETSLSSLCVYPICLDVEGCSDITACNFDNSATDLYESCIYTSGCESCEDGAIIGNDDDNDTVCNDDEVEGCEDDTACNYNVLATNSDGSCIYSIDLDACATCSGVTDGTGTVVDNDLDDDGVCDENEILGCTDNIAINYSELATDDDGSCEYETPECVLPNSFVTNTGANMTLMLTSSFISSLNVTSEIGYIVAITDAGLVVGSALVHENELDDGQVAIPLWADDATTTEIIDGALPGENISLQLVDDGSLYTMTLATPISFSAMDISALVIPVSPEFSCSGEVAPIIGCTDDSACNYNVNATEDDDTCIFEEDGYDCNGVCINDADNDGVCDEFEIVGCTDDTALNYNPLATDSDISLCEYPVPLEGCTDPEANNYNELANIEDGSCLYGIGGCTYVNAVNYNEEATYEDDSCVFDSPFIYVTNPIDGDLLTNTTVSFTYEVVNTIISTEPLASHIKYSVDGGAFGSTYNQVGEITQEFNFGEHTIQFIIYDNVSGNNQPLSPIVETIINFTVGEEGCMNPLAGNYNLNAIIDNGTCIPNADILFDNTNTGSNHTLMVLMSEFGSINVNGLLSQPGDLLGVFYENEGLYFGAGYSTLEEGNIQVAAWGDDATTTEQDGFIEGQSFVWAIQYAETGNSVYLEAIYGSGSSAYTTNGLSTIIGFEIMEFVGVEGCTDSDYVEFNPFADTDDGSCETLKIYGCTEDAFLEYWAYNEDSLTITLLEIIANTNDGSCLTGIVEGCTDTDYLEYCLECNVSDNSTCIDLVVFGCTDPLALNFDIDANTNNGTCEFDICVEIQIDNFEIIFSSDFNVPVLSYDIINLSNEQILLPTFNLNLSSTENLTVSTSLITNSQINPNTTIHVDAIITSDLSTLPPSVALTGFVNMQGESIESGVIDCDFTFTEVYIFTDHIGCTLQNAYNFSSIANVDDGSCIEFIQSSVNAYNPNCSDQFGFLSMFVIGGIPPYSSPTTYTQYSQFSAPQDTSVVVDENGTITLYGLEGGDYSIEIHDSIGNIEFYEFSIVIPEEVLVEANITNSLLLTSTVVQGNAIFYQWLYEGESIEGANSTVHYAQEVGNYQVYIENPNGCGAYSDVVFLNAVGIKDFDVASFNLYPNPVSSVLTVRMSQLSSVASLAITDVLGQEIHSIEIDTRNVSEEYKMDLSSIPNGMYFVVVESDAKQIVKGL